MTKSEPINDAAPLYGIEKHSHAMTVAQLCRGALLHDLLRCALIAQNAVDSLDLQRDGTLLVQRADGRELTLDLTANTAVALIHDGSSARSPLQNGGRTAFSALTRDVPRARMRTIERLAAGMRPPGSAAPWATTLLWSENGRLCTPGSWSNFLAHGGWMIEPLLMEPRSALRGYQRTHNLRDAHVELLVSLLERRLATRDDEWMLLERGEFDLLLGAGKHGFAAANEILLHLKIHTPYRPS